MKNIQVDDRTHKRIKIMAARDGKSIKETVKLALEAYAALRASWKATP